MSDSSLYELVALATGESVLEISRRGFHHATPEHVAFDPEPGLWPREPHRPAAQATLAAQAAGGEAELVDLGEHGIDWDEILAGSRQDIRRPRRRVMARQRARQMAQPVRGVR
jgi:hypothetical protein